MAGGGARLTGDALRAAHSTIAAWRINPSTDAICPLCGAAGLGITDRSARPHAEWYAISCAACGLNESLHIPMAAPLHGD